MSVPPDGDSSIRWARPGGTEMGAQLPPWCWASSACSPAWMPFVFVVGAVCAVLGIIFGAIVLRQRGDPRAFALTGLITGVAGLVLVVLGVVTTRGGHQRPR